MADAWMPGARCIRAETDGGELGGGAPRVVWMTLGADPRVVSVWSAAQRLNEENRPPSSRLGSADRRHRAAAAHRPGPAARWAPPSISTTRPDRLPHRSPSVNHEGRLCVQIGVLGSAQGTVHQLPDARAGRDPRLARLLADPTALAGRAPAPYRQAARPRSRARWALGGHFGASQVPDCHSIGPGGIDIDQIVGTDAIGRELPQPALAAPSPGGPIPIRLGPRTGHEVNPPLPSAPPAADSRFGRHRNDVVVTAMSWAERRTWVRC